MLIKVVTDISFKMPDEYEVEQAFIKTNDMSEWIKYESTCYVMYRNVKNYMNISKKAGKLKNKP